MKLGLIWGGIGTGALLVVVLLLVFQPWQMLMGGPQGTFNQLKRSLLSGNFVGIYDVMSEDGKKQFDSLIDFAVTMDPRGDFTELKGLEGRARFKKFIAIAKEKQPPGQQQFELTSSQRSSLQDWTIKEIEYNNDRTEATLTLNVPKGSDTSSLKLFGNNRNFSDESKMYMVKEAGGWKIKAGP